MYKVFVFGTLKEGFPNFKTNRGHRLAGTYFTESSYPLYLVGDRYVPWLVLDDGKGYKIKGEVFEVSKATLVEMDQLERVSHADGYQRIKLNIIQEETGGIFEAHVYGKTSAQLEDAVIQSRLKNEYTLEHAKRFRHRVL